MKKSKKNRCQCCNKCKASAFHSVFGNEGKLHNIAALLIDYIGKVLNENDGVEYMICDPCWQQLIQYNDFKQKCIRANLATTNNEEEEEQENDEVEMKEDEPVEDVYQNETTTSECVYEDSEYLDEFQNEDFDIEEMNIEYLEEDDSIDSEIFPNFETKKKSIPFDFTAVLVRPVIGNFFLFDTRFSYF